MKIKPIKSPHVKIAIGWVVGITAGVYSFILVRDKVVDKQREEMLEKRRLMREQRARAKEQEVTSSNTS